jgi:predicted N-acyltransferase
VIVDKKYAAPIGGSEEAFLARMRGKTRREFVRQWRRAVDSGVRLRIAHGAEVLRYVDEFTALAVDAAQKHGDNLYGVDQVSGVIDVPGAVLLVAEHDGRMVGAFYGFLYRGRLAMVIAGIDFDRLTELNIYGFLMYETLRYAVANGAEVFDVGRCNFEYKERHAFRGTELWGLAYFPEERPDLRSGLELMNKGMQEYIARKSSE